MNYPIDFTFKLLALASQIYITDAGGQSLGYVKEKMLKLKEDVRVFSDDTQSLEQFSIKADRIIDFSARYNFADARGNYLGSIKRRGMRSIWKAYYEIYDGETQVMQLTEENPWIKVIDAMVGELPVVSMFTGYMFNPAYLVTRMDGTLVARLSKQPSMFGRRFQLSRQGQMSETEETRVLLSCLMMTMLERARG